MKKLLFLLILSAVLGSSCQTTRPVVALNEDVVSILCGTFESTNDKELLSSLTLSGWNTAEFSTPFDGIAQLTEETPNNKPVRPASRYFIGGDTLYVEMDKGYFCYKIKDENTLLGIGFWNNNQKMVRRKENRTVCPETHTLTAGEKTWLRLSRSYYQAYYSSNYDMALPLLERLCEEGHGPACMTLGEYFLKVRREEEKGLALLEKACEIGYFGKYACFRLADALTDLGKEEAAATAYQKACDGGHAVGCSAASLMGTLKK